MFKGILAGVGAVVLGGVLIFGAAFGSYEMYKFFAPRKEIKR